MISYVRRAGDAHAVVVLNLTPVPREQLSHRRSDGGAYEMLLSSDDHEWGGSGYGAFDTHRDATPSPFHGYPQSVELTLPPLGALVLAPGLAP